MIDAITTLDALYMTLSIIAVILGTLLAIILYRVIKILGNAERISTAVATLLDLANTFMIKPIEILTLVLEYVGRFIKKK